MPKDYVRKTARYNGKKYEATGKTELEAMTKLAEKIAAAKRGEEVVGGSMTVSAWQREKDSNPHKQSQSLCAKKLKVAVALCIRATEKFLSTIFPTTPV